MIKTKMFKITAIIFVMFIVSSVWAGCDSCGSECESACGTRRFRACCFNYLRKKRGPDTIKIHTVTQDVRERQQKPPVFIMENIPSAEQWIASLLSNENHPFSIEDMVEDLHD